MENIRQEKYPQPSKNAIKNRRLWECETKKNEKHPQPSKKDKKKKEDRKNTHSQAKKQKKKTAVGMESIRQEKYPQSSKKAKKIDCYGYGEHKTGKIPTAKQKSKKNRLLWVCENRKQ